MDGIKNEIQIEIDGIAYEIGIAKKILKGYPSRHFNTNRENAIIYLLERAVDFCEGCIYLSSKDLLTPIYPLTRCIIETLIWARWITQSKENAMEFTNSGNEIKRIARIILREGHGKVTERASGENATEELLNSEWAEGIRPRLSLFSAAQDVELEKLYRQIFNMLSMYVHGFTFGMEGNDDEDLLAILALTNSMMAGVNLVANDWITRRHYTEKTQLYKILEWPN